jgi:hypothetical protein
MPHDKAQKTYKLQPMKTRFIISLAAAMLGLMHAEAQSFRPPSVPLVTFDPYLSIWFDAALDQTTALPGQFDSRGRRRLSPYGQ